MKLTKELKEKINAIYDNRISTTVEAERTKRATVVKATNEAILNTAEYKKYKKAADELQIKIKEITEPVQNEVVAYIPQGFLNVSTRIIDITPVQNRLINERDNLFIQIQYSTKFATLSAILKKYGIEV